MRWPKLTPLEHKVNRIAVLALNAHEHESAEMFLHHLGAWPRAAKYFPERAERERIIRQMYGDDYLPANLNIINRWLRDLNKPHLQLTEDELMRIVTNKP